MKCFILPPELAKRLEREIGHDPALDHSFRVDRRELVEKTVAAAGIYTANNREVEPGTLLFPPYTDARATEASLGITQTASVLALMSEKLPGRVGTVHYGNNYDNAFWDGFQMVFGDGDGRFFNPFTVDLDVTAHELGHGVTADLLNYSDQAGALNESISDALGATVRQTILKLDINQENSWLIGSHLFTANVSGVALRNMLHPGTAYNDRYLGRDDQPDNMDDYVDTSEDDGGVHTNSGIPNRAFALTAIALGSSQKTYMLWRKALKSVNDPDCSFAKFASATVSLADSIDTAKVLDAWVQVKVLNKNTPVPTPGGDNSPTSEPFPGVDSQVATHILHAAGGPEKVTLWMNHHFKSYFRIKS